MDTILSTPVIVGDYTLKNRIIMPPLTRMRANNNLAPTDLNAEYYRQRSSAGLIIAEGTQISEQAQGYPNTPGIYNKEQVQGWKKVTQSVHQERGLIFVQLWHVGRVGHSSLREDHSLPVAPSPLPANGSAFRNDFSRVPYEIPHELTIEEIKNILNDYRKSALNAKEAGFDGIEIHAANGYLIEQFLRPVSNHRLDEYGGSIPARAKFLFEVIDTVEEIWPVSKIGIRISPFYSGNIIAEENPYPQYDYVVRKLESYKLGYLHVVENRESAAVLLPGQVETETPINELSIKRFRDFYKGSIIAAGGFNKKRAEEVLEKGYADAIAFGRDFISNPDLPYRLINELALNDFDRNTFYGGGSKGYTDYSNKEQFLLKK